MKLRPSGWRLPALFVPVIAASALFAATATAAPKAPTVTTLPIDTTLLSDTYALLSGVVNPNGTPTYYKFQYGTTTAYGSETPTTSASNGKADVPVDVAVDDLAPNTTYHFRLVAFPDPTQPYYGVEQTYGADQTFTTFPSDNVTFASTKAKVVKNKALVALTAVGVPDDQATGRLTLTAKIGKKTKKIGTAPYAITVGKTKTIKVALTGPARKFLKLKRKLKATASAKTKGVATPVTATLKLS